MYIYLFKICKELHLNIKNLIQSYRYSFILWAYLLYVIYFILILCLLIQFYHSIEIYISKKISINIRNEYKMKIKLTYTYKILDKVNYICIFIKLNFILESFFNNRCQWSISELSIYSVLSSIRLLFLSSLGLHPIGVIAYAVLVDLFFYH